ncbi:MAG: PAS domain S-box protein, partial [Methylobacter sp.]
MRKLQYWFRHSLVNRIMVYALFSILIFSLVVGGGSFLVVHQLFQQQVEAQLRADLQRASLELQHVFGESTDMLQQLAASPLLSNALVDSVGRETYLKPFFMEHRLAKQSHADLLLVDFRGQTLLASNTSMKDVADDSALVAKAFTERIPVAEINTKKILVLIYPIIFPVTGTTEGALVYRVYLTELVQAIGKQLDVRFSLNYPDFKISSEPINDESLIDQDEILALTAPLDHFAFKITAAKLRDQALVPLYLMIRWYLIVASVLLLAAIGLSRSIASHVTSGLLTLVEKANAITHADDLSDHLMIIPSDDEIGRLALALNHLIQRLRQFYLELEDKVTERTMALIQAEAIARQSSNYARSLIEASLDPLVTINTQGKISDVNKATELITGLSREQLVGSDFSGYFIDSQRARCGYQQVFSAGQLTDYPLTIRHISGQSTEVVYNFSVYSNEYDEVEGIFAAGRDVTRQKQIEDELKASEEKFRSIIEVSPVPMALNNELTITYLNPAFTQTFGYRREDIPTLADWWLKAYPDPDYRSWVKNTWQATFEQAEREHQSFKPFEVNICIRNGSFKTVVVTAAKISGSLQNEHLVVLYDISDRKRDEIDLRIAATAFESQEGMIVTDANMNILRVNSAFTDITGYTAEEVVGKNPRLLQSGR